MLINLLQMEFFAEYKVPGVVQIYIYNTRAYLHTISSTLYTGIIIRCSKYLFVYFISNAYLLHRIYSIGFFPGLFVSKGSQSLRFLRRSNSIADVFLCHRYSNNLLTKHLYDIELNFKFQL